MITFLSPADLEPLEQLPSFSSYPYAATPGQGHEDEKLVLDRLASRHWTQLTSTQLCELASAFMVVKPRDEILLLPAIARARYFLPVPDLRLYTLCESVEYCFSTIDNRVSRPDGRPYSLLMKELILEFEKPVKVALCKVVIALLMQIDRSGNFAIAEADASFWKLE